MAEPKLSLEEALTLLTSERVALISKIIRDGLAIYDDPKEYGPGARRDHTPRTKADNRNCHIVAEGRRQTLGRDDIRVQERDGRVLFIIEDRLCLAFKKLDQRLRSRSSPTRRSRRFELNLPLGIDLPPELTNVIAGYTLDAVGTPEQMYVTCPNGKTNAWVLPLGNVTTDAEITQFPVATPVTDIAERRRSRVILKQPQMREADGSAE